MRNLNYLMDHIFYQIFKIIMNMSLKKHGEKTDNPSIMICVNTIENRITFKIQNRILFLSFTHKTMKLLGRTKNEITKNENGENVSHLKITKVVLGYCNIVNNYYHQDSRVLHTLVPNKSFGQLLDFHPKILYF